MVSHSDTSFSVSVSTVILSPFTPPLVSRPAQHWRRYPSVKGGNSNETSDRKAGWGGPPSTDGGGVAPFDFCELLIDRNIQSLAEAVCPRHSNTVSSTSPKPHVIMTLSLYVCLRLPWALLALGRDLVRRDDPCVSSQTARTSSADSALSKYSSCFHSTGSEMLLGHQRAPQFIARRTWLSDASEGPVLSSFSRLPRGSGAVPS